MSDFITVLRDTCPVPVLDATKWKRIDGATSTHTPRRTAAS